METTIFSLALMLLTSHVILTSSTTLYNTTTDRFSLLSFKNAITSDPQGILRSNWSSNSSICYWTGVSCSIKHDRVTALNLSGLWLQGNISPHLGNLTFLQSLDISSNNFSGVIPFELSNLPRLEVINMGSNNLTGEIPGGILINMSSLVEIDMRENGLSGMLPYDICSGDLPKLRRLDLTDNELSGRIPVGMYRCRMMEELKLSDNLFSGKIASEIGNLTMLRILSLYSNQLEGEIPSSISNFSSLEYVDLSDNKFSGSIPTFYNSLKLQELYLYSNNFTGLIPKQLGNLTSLINLDLAYNKLSGELPEELGNLVYLEHFEAPFNYLLNGSIPASIFNISTLNTIALMQNRFSGSLPPSMGSSLPNLERLFLFHNRLSGEIPRSIANASKLTVLELNSNSFTGSIPDFGNLRYLQVLRLWENNLTGEVSPTQELRFLSSLTICRDLKNLEISDNPRMNGVLPASVSNLSTSLVTFSAFKCSIRGVIPSDIGNLRSLQVLDLSKNKLTGFIPTSIGNLDQIGKLYLDGNQLEGYIPHELCQMSNLMNLYLGVNLLSGSIPECLEEVKSLRRVSFAANKLNSTLPPKFLNLVDLIVLDLSSNYLSGWLPDAFGNLKAIYQLNLSFNKFSGHIPSSIGTCESLEFLYLSSNAFNGSIPQSLGNAKGLIKMDLCNNDLSGSIPRSLEKLNLQMFNVSNNQLEGEIPGGGCFANFTARSFLNNAGLCGTAKFQVLPCREHRRRSKNVSLILKYIIPPFIAVMILVAAIVVLIRKCRKRNIPPADETSKCRKRKIPPADETSKVGVDWMVVSERELSQGTDSFSDLNLLGKGSIGSVYKATLPVKEKDVAVEKEFAVKVFNLQAKGATKIFDTESRIMSSIRHRNLVKILGCCSNMNTEFKALILAYMPNGSLETWLHSDKYFIDLIQRLKITIDVALALEYLHHYHTYTVVHCDIKPSNVLLDADMTAHVADFGISKLFDDGQTEVQTNRMATFGYAAPELGEGKISTGGDVYSYGILLLEMFTSKRPTDDMFGPEMSIKDWVEKALQDETISEIVAPGLVSREDSHFPAKLRCVSLIFELAMRCLAFSPKERVNMMQVAVSLQKIKVPVEDVKKQHRR